MGVLKYCPGDDHRGIGSLGSLAVEPWVELGEPGMFAALALMVELGEPGIMGKVTVVVEP